MTIFIIIIPALALAVLVWLGSRWGLQRALWSGSGERFTQSLQRVWPVLFGALVGLLVRSFVGGLVALLGATAWPRMRLWFRRRKMQQDLTLQMPAFLEALAAGLRAGLSLPQSMAAAEEDLPQPSAQVARRLWAGLGLGTPIEDLMQAEAERLSPGALAADWRLLATAVGIQRSSGGDLAATLDQLTETLRERQRLQAQVDALTAQGRLSAWVLGLLPLALMAALQAMDPELLAPLFHTQTGWVLLALAVLFEGAGVLLLRRIVDIEA